MRRTIPWRRTGLHGHNASMLGFSVETLDINDPVTAAAVWAAQRAAYEVEAELIGFAAIPPLHETLDELVSNDLSWLGIRNSDGAVVAALGLVEDGDLIDIDRLFVAPGSFRNGHARALLAELSPAKTVTVSAARDNAPAIRLYETAGFARVDEDEVVPGLTIIRFKREAL